MEPKIDRATGEVLYAVPRGPRSKPKTNMIYRGMILHDLRRSGARALVDAGVPEKVAMAIGVWKTRCVFDRYKINSRRNFVEAGRKLGILHSQKVGDISGTIERQTETVDSPIN